MSVKTFQHKKAMGNARTQVRGFMFPIFYDAPTATATPYGTEPPRPGSSTLTFDRETGAGIIAMGRLERVDPSTLADSVRVSYKEPYRLYWLPYGYEETSDYAANPPSLTEELGVDTGLRSIAPGMMLWLATTCLISPPHNPADLANYEGEEAVCFRVMEAPISVLGDVLEHEALICRDLASPRRVLAHD